MNIGVSGASGHLGSATVRELKARLGAGANIVAISRTPVEPDGSSISQLRARKTLVIGFRSMRSLG